MSDYFPLSADRAAEAYTAELIASADEYEKRAASLQLAIESFYDSIAQYNVLCNCVRAARNRVAPVIYCLDRTGSF